MSSTLELLQQAASMMLMGMLVVFVFLGALILAVQAMSRVVQKLSQPPQTSASDAISTAHAPSDPVAIAAATAAVHHHRRCKNSE